MTNVGIGQAAASAASGSKAAENRHWHPSGYALGWTAVAATLCGGMIIIAKLTGMVVPGCFLRDSTGFPCPACGLSRLGVSPMDGRAGQAAAADPAGAILLIVLGAVLLDFLLRHLLRRPAEKARTGLILLVVGLLGAHWVTTIVTGGVP